MYNLVQIKPQLIRNSVIWSALPGRIRLVALALVCFGISHASRAVTPAPDGGYGNGNTAEGTDALLTLTTGSNNTAIGAFALVINTTGTDNTATGSGALIFNRTGSDNTATGSLALYNNTASDNTATGFNALNSNSTGTDNTATGFEALSSNTNGNFNTATGSGALANTTNGDNTADGGLALNQNTSGFNNTAVGFEALNLNTTGIQNTASGASALLHNTTGSNNTAIGDAALFSNTTASNNTAQGLLALGNSTTGHDNTAEGAQALANDTTGSSNVALGSNAGLNLTTGSNNIDIGANVLGNSADANTIRIGKSGTQQKTFVAGIYGKTVASGVGVIINSLGQLGTVQSSARFKDDIKPMDEASEALLKLKPVTFRYKEELDPEKIPQFGLIAEEVEKVCPGLVVRDEDGKVTTVRYEAVNAMLLNEFLKEHRKVQEDESTITELKSANAKQNAAITVLQATAAQQRNEFQAAVAQQQKELKTLAAVVKEQAAQIQKVGTQFEVSKPLSQVVLSTQ
jgi:hypothetical protein